MGIIRTEPLRVSCCPALGAPDAAAMVPFTDDLLRRRGTSTAPVLIDDRGQVSGDELMKLVASIATVLRRNGVGTGSVVCSQLTAGRTATALAHSVFALGGVYSPILPTFGRHELVGILAELRPKVVVAEDDSQANSLSKLAPDAHLLVGDEALLASFSDGAGFDLRTAQRAIDDAALVLYTSGTSSRPKGAIHTMSSLRRECDSLADAHEITAADVILSAMPIAHIGGFLYSTLLPVTTGATAVLMRRWSAPEALDLARANRVTVLPAVPTFIRQLLALEPSNEQLALRLVTLGGSNVDASDIARTAQVFGCFAKRTYGSTELPTLTTGRRGDGNRVATTEGRVIGSARVRIEGPAGEILGVGEPGEIVGTGPELFAGYVDAGADAAAFTPDGWYRTGDVGWLDGDGFLTVSGRLGDMIIRGGENISPTEIELALEAQTGVQEAAVVGVPDQMLGERVHAVVVATREFDPVECRRVLLGSEMARHKVPDVIWVWDSIPHTASGKVQRAMVRAALGDRARSSP